MKKGICVDCLYWNPDIQTNVKGWCYRYPDRRKKLEPDWCGEWESRCIVNVELRHHLPASPYVYESVTENKPEYLVGYLAGYERRGGGSNGESIMLQLDVKSREAPLSRFAGRLVTITVSDASEEDCLRYVPQDDND